jgi:hypothetical protein
MTDEEVYKFMREFDEKLLSGKVVLEDIHNVMAALRLTSFAWSKSRRAIESLNTRLNVKECESQRRYELLEKERETVDLERKQTMRKQNEVQQLKERLSECDRKYKELRAKKK